MTFQIHRFIFKLRKWRVLGLKFLAIEKFCEFEVWFFWVPSLPSRSYFFVFLIFCFFFYFLWRSKFTDSYSGCGIGEYWDWNFWRLKSSASLKFGFSECLHCPLGVIFLLSSYFVFFSSFYDVPNSQIHIQVAVMASTGIKISGEWKVLWIWSLVFLNALIVLKGWFFCFPHIMVFLLFTTFQIHRFIFK